MNAYCTSAANDAASASQARSVVEAVYRAERRRILATLISLLGSRPHAEEALQGAFLAALERWPREGIPEDARQWLIQAGRKVAFDECRRRGFIKAAA